MCVYYLRLMVRSCRTRVPPLLPHVPEHIAKDHGLTSLQERSKYRNRIFVGFGMIGVTFAIVIIVIFVSCTPITKWWQMNPDPGRE